MKGYLRFPTTFDGNLPSDAFGRPTARVVIGETYIFDDIGEATVTSAIVWESEKKAAIGVTDGGGRAHILTYPMSEEELAEYAEYRDAYFGRVAPVSNKAKDDFELFEWFMTVQKELPRAKMLEWLSGTPNLSEFETLSDEDLRIAYCEGLVGAVRAKRPQAKAS